MWVNILPNTYQMKIAVIGDYTSPGYKVLFGKAKLWFMDDETLDLSRHDGNNWKLNDEKRIADIKEAHLIIVCNDWKERVDVLHDLTAAMSLNKEIMMDCKEGFISFEYLSRRS